jgi:hypothetical protein
VTFDWGCVLFGTKAARNEATGDDNRAGNNRIRLWRRAEVAARNPAQLNGRPKPFENSFHDGR